MGARLKRSLPVVGTGIAICLLLLAACPNPLFQIVQKEVANFAGRPEIQISRGAVPIPSGGSADIGTALISATKAVTFTIENSGQADLTLNGSPKVALSGADTDCFAVGALPFSTIEPGENSTFTLEFTPDLAEAKSVVVTIESNDPDESTYSFTTNGLGSAGPGPDISLLQGSTNIKTGDIFAFGGIAAGTNKDVVFTIYNVGTPGYVLHLAADPVVITGGSGMFSELSPPANLNIAEGGSTSFSLRFAPTVAGDYTATVSIPSDDPDEPGFSYTITGTGQVPDIELRKDATVLTSGVYEESFPAVRADGENQDASSPVTYTIRNNGLAPLTLSSITLGGADSADFDLNNTASSPVAPGGSTTFTVRFDPLTVGANRRATVSIASNDPDTATFTFDVKGDGTFAPKVYWVNRSSGTIMKANLNGSNPATVLGGLPQPIGLAIDQTNNRMYWTEYGGQVRRANLDGTGVVTVLTVSAPYGIDLDVPSDRLYVITFGGRLYKSTLAGGSSTYILVPGGIGFGIGVDEPNGMLYWTDYGASVYLGSTAPSSYGPFVSAASGNTSGLALDLTARYVYWAVKYSGYIFRSSLDSPGPEPLLNGLGEPNHIALDLGNQKMYWTETSGMIFRTNLDGSGRELVIGGQANPYGIALDLVP